MLVELHRQRARVAFPAAAVFLIETVDDGAVLITLALGTATSRFAVDETYDEVVDAVDHGLVPNKPIQRYDE